MRKLSVFNSISLDGYFTDANSDMSWAHKSDPEFDAFTRGNASGDGVLVFGRVTYQLMIKFWPTPMAKQSMPAVADKMNSAQKIVFSNTLKNPTWNNTRAIGGDIVAAMREIKQQPGADMVMMGSGQIVAQMTQADLIDQFQFVVCPIVLGAGRTLFEGVTRRPALNRLEERAFGNGNVFLRYEPAR